MVTKTNPEYEYKTWNNPNNYEFREEVLVGHKYGFIKRRKYASESKFMDFKPKCKCKYKFDVWVRSREAALALYNLHVKECKEINPRLDIE